MPAAAIGAVAVVVAVEGSAMGVGVGTLVSTAGADCVSAGVDVASHALSEKPSRAATTKYRSSCLGAQPGGGGGGGGGGSG
jgi:hypothetical protein